MHVVNAEGAQISLCDLLSAAGKYKAFCLELMHLEEVC